MNITCVSVLHDDVCVEGLKYYSGFDFMVLTIIIAIVFFALGYIISKSNKSK